MLAGRFTEDRRSLLAARLETARRRADRRPGPERRRGQQSGDRPHARLRDLDQRPLRQLPRRRRHRHRHRHGLDRVRAVVRRPHRRAGSRRLGAGADLAAHAERPADRGACRQHRSDPPVRSSRLARPSHLRWGDSRRHGAGRPAAHRGRRCQITLLHPPGYDYYRLLRSKLHWGRGGQRQRQRRTDHADPSEIARSRHRRRGGTRVRPRAHRAHRRDRRRQVHRGRCAAPHRGRPRRRRCRASGRGTRRGRGRLLRPLGRRLALARRAIDRARG